MDKEQLLLEHILRLAESGMPNEDVGRELSALRGAAQLGESKFLELMSHADAVLEYWPWGHPMRSDFIKTQRANLYARVKQKIAAREFDALLAMECCVLGAQTRDPRLVRDLFEGRYEH